MAALAAALNRSTIAAILLAAGGASRFGGDKLAAAIGGETVLTLSATALAETGCPLRAAVVREDSSVHARRLRNLDFDVIVNHDANRGLSTSIRAGVAWAAARGARGVLLALADMPFVTPAHYDRLFEKAASSRNGIAYSACAQRRSSPAIFAAGWFGELLALDGDTGARALLQSAPMCDGVEAPREMLFDIDAPGDLFRIAR